MTANCRHAEHSVAGDVANAPSSTPVIVRFRPRGVKLAAARDGERNRAATNKTGATTVDSATARGEFRSIATETRD